MKARGLAKGPPAFAGGGDATELEGEPAREENESQAGKRRGSEMTRRSGFTGVSGAHEFTFAPNISTLHTSGTGLVGQQTSERPPYALDTKSGSDTPSLPLSLVTSEKMHALQV